MITHFHELELTTVSIQGVKQFYYDQLGFPITAESSERITFEVTPYCSMTFKLAFEPISPVHVAFEVPLSEFYGCVELLKQSNIPILKWDDGREVDQFETGMNVYFRDGDGHLLEIIAHHYIPEEVIIPSGKLKVLYLREIGFPVEGVREFREWLVQIMKVKLDKVRDDFTFAIGGTAHCVVTSFNRRWNPISMLALPTKMRVTLGVSDKEFIRSVYVALEGEEVFNDNDEELYFNKNGYSFVLKVTEFDKDIAKRMNLPYSREI